MSQEPTHLKALFSWIRKNVTPEDITVDNSVSIGTDNPQPREDQKEAPLCVRTPKCKIESSKDRRDDVYAREDKGKGTEKDEQGDDAEGTVVSEHGDEGDDFIDSKNTRVYHCMLEATKSMIRRIATSGGSDGTPATGLDQTTGNDDTPNTRDDEGDDPIASRNTRFHRCMHEAFISTFGRISSSGGGDGTRADS